MTAFQGALAARPALRLNLGVRLSNPRLCVSPAAKEGFPAGTANVVTRQRCVMAKEAKRLSFKLTDEQLRALKPIIDAVGKIIIAGEITGDTLKFSFIACNSPFVACNSPFVACNSPFTAKKVEPK
jgi:hypothetical protein